MCIDESLLTSSKFKNFLHCSSAMGIFQGLSTSSPNIAGDLVENRLRTCTLFFSFRRQIKHNKINFCRIKSKIYMKKWNITGQNNWYCTILTILIFCKQMSQICVCQELIMVMNLVMNLLNGHNLEEKLNLLFDWSFIFRIAKKYFL